MSEHHQTWPVGAKLRIKAVEVASNQHLVGRHVTVLLTAVNIDGANWHRVDLDEPLPTGGQFWRCKASNLEEIPDQQFPEDAGFEFNPEKTIWSPSLEPVVAA